MDRVTLLVSRGDAATPSPRRTDMEGIAKGSSGTRMLSARSVAGRLGCSMARAYELLAQPVAEGGIPALRLSADGAYRVRESDLEQWIAAHTY